MVVRMGKHERCHALAYALGPLCSNPTLLSFGSSLHPGNTTRTLSDACVLMRLMQTRSHCYTV